MAHGLRAESRKNVAVDFLNPSLQEKLIRYLYQHLLRYTEQHTRYAARLDHAGRGGDHDDDVPPLLHRLVGEDGGHPLTKLVEQEDEASIQRLESDLPHSLAGAYVGFLRRLEIECALSPITS